MQYLCLSAFPSLFFMLIFLFCLFVCLLNRFDCLSSFLSLPWSICLFVCLCVCLFVCLFVYFFVCLFILLTIPFPGFCKVFLASNTIVPCWSRKCFGNYLELRKIFFLMVSTFLVFCIFGPKQKVVYMCSIFYSMQHKIVLPGWHNMCSFKLARVGQFEMVF